MKKRILILVVFLAMLLSSSFAQTENPSYDPELAKTFDADDYGMKSYIFVILKTGSVVVEDKALRDSLFAGHLENIGRLADDGKLVVAGPLGKNDRSYRGIFILNVKTEEEAALLLETDPAIREKLLEAEVYKWYGAAALGEYIKVQEKITKLNF
ncbi:MAG: hypothetical protein IH598_10870 [Bacteroidales bacterium]|nr:hypothetical protein [Bacteroidales bacterium]